MGTCGVCECRSKWNDSVICSFFFVFCPAVCSVRWAAVMVRPPWSKGLAKANGFLVFALGVGFVMALLRRRANGLWRIVGLTHVVSLFWDY